MTGTIDVTEARELDARTGDGIDVRLLWYAATESVTVSVYDAKYGNGFELVVEPKEALDAFHHPFGYASFHGIEFDASTYDEGAPSGAARG
jgi:hypothetical protein